MILYGMKGLRKQMPSKEWLNEALEYFPETGILKWNPERPRSHFRTEKGWNRYKLLFSGREAGCRRFRACKGGKEPSDIGIFFMEYGVLSAHSIIFHMNGIIIPNNVEVDHKNRNPFDNSWNNLRLATSSQNCWNRKKRCDSKNNLPVGIRKIKFQGIEKYAATLTYHQQSYPLGLHDNLEDAVKARKSAEEKFHGDFIAQKWDEFLKS